MKTKAALKQPGIKLCRYDFAWLFWDGSRWIVQVANSRIPGGVQTLYEGDLLREALDVLNRDLSWLPQFQ